MRTVALSWLLLGSCSLAAALGGCKEKDDPEGASGDPKAITSRDGGRDFEYCGSVVCRAGRECCNASCGICTAADVACSEQICKRGDDVTSLAPQCGGNAERPCPGEGRCLADSGEECDPSDSDCGGTCHCAQSATCPAGSHWNAAPQLCGCEVDDDEGGGGDRSGGGEGGGSDDNGGGGRDAGGGSGGSGGDDNGGGGSSGDGGGHDAGTIGGSGGSGTVVTCGEVTCASGQVCCNESCSICAPPDAACSQQLCIPGGGGGSGAPVLCGSTPCATGQVCCDPSCGLCANDQNECGKLSCSDPGPHPGDPCDLQCATGERCEYVSVTCVQAPCPPLPECVPYSSCGGVDGVACPGSGSCVDDPSDDCDPGSGAADCPGACICSPTTAHICKVGWQFDFSASVCACRQLVINCIPERPCTAGL